MTKLDKEKPAIANALNITHSLVIKIMEIIKIKNNSTLMVSPAMYPNHLKVTNG